MKNIMKKDPATHASILCSFQLIGIETFIFRLNDSMQSEPCAISCSRPISWMEEKQERCRRCHCGHLHPTLNPNEL